MHDVVVLVMTDSSTELARGQPSHSFGAGSVAVLVDVTTKVKFEQTSTGESVKCRDREISCSNLLVEEAKDSVQYDIHDERHGLDAKNGSLDEKWCVGYDGMNCMEKLATGLAKLVVLGGEIWLASA